MPTTKLYGTESAANKAIGGVPQLYYFDFQSKGRGQVLRLLWEDAGIAYKDTRFSFAEYPDFKKTQLAEMNPLATIPVVELNGKILTQSYAVLRYFARTLGAYDGQTSEEKYWVDALCDAAADWRTRFVDAFFSDNQEKDYAAHCANTRPKFLKGLNGQLTAGPDKGKVGAKGGVNGPFALGQNVTYGDLVIYQVCHDEGLTKDAFKALDEYPEVKKLCQAVEQRPNVMAFMKSDRYLG